MTSFDGYVPDDIASTMKERDYKCPTDLVVAEAPAALGFDKSRGQMTGEVSGTLRCNAGKSEGVNDGKADNQCVIFQPSALVRGKGSKPSETTSPTLQAESDGDQRPVVAYSVGLGSYPAQGENVAATLTGRKGDPGCVAFPIGNCGAAIKDNEIAPTLTTNKGDPGCIAYVNPRILHNSETSNQVGIKDGQLSDALCTDGPGGVVHGTGGTVIRRLLPVECERLQGLPDNWTLVDKAKDSPRYKQLGNAVSETVVAWIAKRIKKVVV